MTVVDGQNIRSHLYNHNVDDEFTLSKLIPLLWSLQVVRITVPDLTGTLINQSALVDKHNDLVTYSVTSPANHTTTVLFDIKHVRSRPVESVLN